ncbi:hypothetical protein [Ekhidna sp. To15]|uniref:hypothetical protein n=1 Tax=Ekhidna sp. To15 TaxID=3395267 RepID=UPI003F5235C7
MKKLFFASVLVIFVLTGCTNDDEQSVDLTTEEGQELLDGSATSLTNDIISLVESEGVSELSHVVVLLNEYSLLNGRISQKNWTKERLKVIYQYFVEGPTTRVGNSSPTTFEEIKGLYTWNFDLQDFDVEESEFFIVKFPTEESNSNNAEFGITNLDFQTITEVWEDIVDEYEVPTVINGYLKVNNATIVELSYDVKWAGNGTPEVADVTLLIDPFRFVLNFRDTFTKSTSLLSSISINEDLITSIDVDVSYETESKEDPYLIEGNVQYRGLKIEGNVDAREIGLEGDPNDFINLALYSNNLKIGDIVFVLEEDSDGFQDYIPYVQYSDGTKENLEDILAPVFEEIEAIFIEFE